MKRVFGLFVVTWAVCLTLGTARLLHSKHEAGLSADDDTDVYLDRVYRQCKEPGNKSALNCLKYRTLEFVHRVTNDPSSSTQIWGPISIVRTPSSANPSEDSMIAELQPRATDSELEQMYKFSYRQLERFASTHALSWTLRAASEEGDSGRAKDVLGGRGKKKKALKLFLPILLLLKIKLLVLVTLIFVVGIKKLLLLGLLLGPLLITKLKLAAVAHQPEIIYGGSPPHHEHHHTASVDYGGGSEGYGGYPYGGWGSYRRQAGTEPKQ